MAKTSGAGEDVHGQGSAGGMGRAYAVLAVLCLSYMLAAVDRNLLGILVEPIRKDIPLSDTQFGLLTGFAFVFFYSLFGVPLGRLADRTNRRRLLAVGIGFWSLMTAMCGAASGFFMLALGRMGVGVGEATCLPVSQSLITDYFTPAQRSRALAILTATGFAALPVSGLLVGGLAQAFGWRAALYVLGGAGVCVALLVHFVIREPVRGGTDVAPADPAIRAPAPSRESIVIAIGDVFSRPNYIPVLLGFTAAMVGPSVMGAWFAPFIQRSYGMGVAEAGAMIGLFAGLPGIVGALSGGFLASYLAKRTGDQRHTLLIPVVVCSVATVMFGLCIALDSKLATLVFCALGTLSATMMIAPCTAFLLGLAPPARRALASSLQLLGQNLVAAGLAPLAVGLVSDALKETFGVQSLRYAMMVIPVCLLTGVGCMTWALIRYRRFLASEATASPAP